MELAKSSKPKKKKNPKKSPFGDAPIPKSPNNNTYKFTRNLDSSLIYQLANAEAVGTYQFKLADVPNNSEFTNLFDQYRFDCVIIHFRSLNNFNSISLSTFIPPRLYTVIDYDDNTNPSGLIDLRQYQSLIETRFDRDIKRIVRPRYSVEIYNGTTASPSGISVRKQWIDVGDPNIPHFGVKFGISAGAIGQLSLGGWSVELTYYLSFKFVR